MDAANVVGSRPNGWWRDRGRAAASLCRELHDALVQGRLVAPLTLVLEGAARRGSPECDGPSLRVVHAPGSGDDTIVKVARLAVSSGEVVTVVTADRELRERVRRLGCEVVGPRWLRARLETPADRGDPPAP